TDDEGFAIARWVLGTSAGVVQSVEVRSVGEEGEGESGPRTLFHSLGLPDEPAIIAPTVAGPRSGEAGAVLADPVEIRVTDQYGNVRVGAAVNWVVKGGGGTVSPTSSVTDASGVARTTWTLGAAMGSAHRLEALTNPGLVTEIA